MEVIYNFKRFLHCVLYNSKAYYYNNPIPKLEYILNYVFFLFPDPNYTNNSNKYNLVYIVFTIT